MSTTNKQMDDEFLTEDAKEDDLFDDLDNAAEEELLHFSEAEDDFLEETQDDQIEYVDEEGNPVELQDGEQVELLESEDVIELGTQINTSDFLSQSETEENDKIETSDLMNSGKSCNDHSMLDDSIKSNPSNAFDEAEEDDDEDDEEEQRNRFRTERRNIVTINSSKRSTRDIPDSLDSVVLEEEEIKAAEFMNRQKDRKRGNWRINQRGVIPGIQRLSNNKPPSLSVMPQPQSRPKDQVGVVHGATRLPPPQNFQQQDVSTILENQNLSSQSNSAPPTPPTPRKILINPHFRGPRPSPPQSSPQQIRSYESQQPVEVSSQSDAGRTGFTPSQIPPQHYDQPYDQDPNYRHYVDAPIRDYHHRLPPPSSQPPPQAPPQQYHHPGHHQPHHSFHHANFNHHISQPHPRIPHPPLQRPQHSANPPFHHHHPPDHRDAWNRPPPPHQPPVHHMGHAPPVNQHIPNSSHPPPYEHQYRGPEPLQHHQEPLFGHHPGPPQHRFQDPHHFSNVPQFPAPPHPLHNFRPQHTGMPHNTDYNYRPPPLPRPEHHDPPPSNFDNYHQSYENYPIDSYAQPRESQSNLYKSFDNHEWGKSSYSNAPIPQNHQNVPTQHTTFHEQTSRGLKRGFVQRRQVNKRPLNINDQTPFNIATSPKQLRTELRTLSKNIKEVPITETLPPAPLPPGKEILPPEDEDEETKELRLKLQEQKRIREENLRKKEERRRQMAAQRMKELKDRVNREQNAQSTSNAVTNTPLPKKPVLKTTEMVLKNPNQRTQASPNVMVKKKVVVVRRSSQTGNQQTNVSTVPKMVLVSNQNVTRGRGRGQSNQFFPRTMQNFPGGPRFPIPKLNSTVGPFIRAPAHVLRNPVTMIQNTNVRPANPRIIQRGNPRQKMLRKVPPVKVPPNRQVIVGTSPPKPQLDISNSRRVQLPEVETHPTNRIVRPPQSQERSVLINNLSATTTENQLRQLTQGIGVVEVIKLLKDGRAYVTFKQAQHANQFQKKYQRHMLDLSMIQVSMVSPQVS